MNRWVAVLGCLAALMAVTHSAAVPTQDTLVVAKSDDTISTTPSMPEPESTTEESSPPIKLTEMEVTSEVSLRYAHTTVVARVRNPAKRAQEAHFRVLLPETAFISGFVMTLDGKSYKAYVKEKEEAKQIYQDAVSHGIGAAHIATKARDSNHFTVNVNVEASSSAVFNLTYEELLVRRNSVYNHAINLHPGTLVPKLTVTVHIKEGAKISELRVPEIRTGNEIDATKDDAQNSKVTIVKSNEDREATITFTPDLQEQERLIQIYAQKSKESAAASNSHSWYQPEPEKEVTPEGVLGQFVVQYDVDRPKDGEILVNDGYFVHFFAPSDLQPLNKFVVFVLDTSGSMMDRKIVQLREAMQTILSDLNAGDYFSIVEFSSAVTVHDLNEADREPPKHRYSFFDYDKETTLVPPSPATSENIAKAKVIVSWLQASGGTNIGKALDVAVELINKGVDWTMLPIALPANSSADVTTSTSPAPTEVSAEHKAAKSLEPIIIFLTDGDPTVGETDPKRIINHVQEKNYGENKALIYSLAFGEDADRKFLRKVSLRNGGFMRHIYEAADAALQLRDFYRQISSPLLAHLNFTYPPGQVKADSVTRHTFRNYFKGSEVVVAGRVDHDATELSPHVDAFCGVGRDGYGRKRYEIVPKVPVEQKKSGYLPLERLWSYLTIKQLLDQHDADDAPAHADKDKENTPEKKALALALKYEFVTPLTSLVVVKPNATNAVDAVSVDKTASSQLFPSSVALSSPVLPGYPPPSGPSAQYGAFAHISGHGNSYASGPAGIQSDALLMSESEHLNEPVFQIDDYDSGNDDTGSIRFHQKSSPSYATRSDIAHPGFDSFAGMFDASFTRPLAYHHHRPLLFALRGPSMTMSFHRRGYPSSASRLNIVHPAHDSFTSFSSGLARPVGPYSHPMYAITGSRPSTTTPRADPSTTSKPTLSEFSLQNFTWVEPLLHDNSIRFEANSTDVILKLVKDNVPTQASGDAACDTSVTGGAGVCVYLTRCVPARDITLDIYKTTYCTINTEFAGVCCPKTEVISSLDSISQNN